MKADLGRLMKQAQKMQADMQKAQQELEQLEVTGQSGGGMVSVTMSGKREVRRVSIDDESLLQDKSMLEDLMAAATNDAMRRLDQLSKEKMSGLTGGLGLPEGFQLPF